MKRYYLITRCPHGEFCEIIFANSKAEALVQYAKFKHLICEGRGVVVKVLTRLERKRGAL